MTPQELKRFAVTCAELGDGAADGSGFIALHRLASVLRAEVEFRPLLVEALIAAPTSAGNWKVLVDSEAYAEESPKFSTESPTAPLSARLRNTIAHELLHTLSFRSEEFGFKLEPVERETREEAVKRLERETEGFSPFLIISQTAIESELEARPLSLELVMDWRNRWSASREVLVARLGLFQSLPEFRLRYHRHVANVAVLLAEWMSKESFTLRDWPVYSNFRDGIVPEFILQLRNKGKPLMRDLFPDPSFILNGGASTVTTAELPAGTVKNPRGDRLRITASAETVSPKKGESFFILFTAENA